MRYLSLILAINLLIASLVAVTSATNERHNDSPYLALTANSLDENNGVRNFIFLKGFYNIGVWENHPFEIQVTSSYPLEPTAVYLAMSDGTFRSMEELRTEYRCEYLVPYYGLVIAEYPDERVEHLSFYINTAWRDSSYPDEFPPLTMPEIEDEDLSQYIQWWWDVVVEPNVAAKEVTKKTDW